MVRAEQNGPVDGSRPLVEMFLEKAGSALVKIEDVELLQGDNGDVGLSVETLNELALLTGEEGVIWMRAADPKDQPQSKSQVSYASGNVLYDFSRSELSVDGNITVLTPREAQMFELLVRNSGVHLSTDAIQELIWGPYASIGIVNVYIGYLRKRLGNHRGIIKTRKGRGYIIDDRIGDNDRKQSDE